MAYLEDRVTALESGFVDLSERVAAGARLTALRDADLSDVQAVQRAHTRSFSALRETQVEQGKELERHGQVLDHHTEVLEHHGQVLDRHTEILDHHTEVLEHHGQVLDHHTEILDHHTEVLEQHGQVLDHHTEVLEHHGQVLDHHTEILDQHTEVLGQHGEQLTGIVSTLADQAVGQQTIIGMLGRLIEREFPGGAQS